ncbi:HEAT repeat domain-containing protein [Aeromonas dhakensis]|uniref:HEAT repeat domain-containing protein n=1 Tax=Aeromonas dhakensis TaxID=196024 RepID=UPI003BA0ED4B
MNKEKLINGLLKGASASHYETRQAALIAIGDTGLIGEDKLVAALEKGASSNHYGVKQAAYTGMGRMLKNSNRQ